MRRDKKDEEDGRANMYVGLEKSTVLQEARVFNETPLKVRKCTDILTKILVVLGQGDQLGRTEATEAFFAMTKLFQCKDIHLRRLVYIVIKEMAAVAEDVIIVTSSLTKDMTGKEDAFRGPSIRALCRITDAGMLQSIERFMKQAIVDRSAPVSSAAMVSAYQLLSTSQDVVRRWSNEIQEAVNSENLMVQYHALGLLHQIRKSDRLAVTKLVQKYSKSSLRSPLAYCYLIRVASKLIREGQGIDSASFEFLENCLRNKSEIVVYEAARAIVALEQTSAKDLAPAVSVLQMFLSSPKSVLRFAAVRTLNQVAMKHPTAVTACNLDLEQLISDSNRSIATLAITTLLKTGSEASVDRLMKQISSFMTDISDEFKVVVVQSVKALCTKYPRKQTVMMTFLSQMLREEGSFEYKRSIVDTLLSVIEENPESKEAGLSHLCEFIEDCEHPSLAVKTLHLLGEEGPKTMRPSNYIRYIYNRVILEVASVRAAAVSALAKFGALHPPLLDSVLVLLERCKLDLDDEVRDRATLYHQILKSRSDQLNSQFILNPMQASPVGVEQALIRYCNSNASQQEKFDLRSVPVQAPAPKKAEERNALTQKSTKPLETEADKYARQLASIPALAGLGSLFKCSEPVRLTEEETEYSVACIKHMFSDYVVLQFDLLNTLPDQRLENVEVKCEAPDEWELVKVIPADLLSYNKTAVSYSVFRPAGISACSIGCTLKFIVKDCDPNTGEPDSDDGYQDEYVLEDLDIGISDFVVPVVKPNFSAAWEDLSVDSEEEDTFCLASMNSIADTISTLISLLGLAPCDRSEKSDSSRSTHTLTLAGMFRGGHDVLIRCKLAVSGSTQGVTMNMAVRSSDPELSKIFIGAVG